MTPEESLDCAKRYLDEATENLTFDEFEWAFEESWRGVDAQCIVGPASGRR